MDLDDFNNPTEAPVRKARFAPKSKLKKQPAKSEPNVEEVKPVVVAVKKEEDSSAVVKMDVDGDSSAVATNGCDDVASASGAAAVAGSSNCEEMEKEGIEEDYVVAEYDVYFNPPASDTKLYVMQYPLRPSWRPYELDQRCTEVRVRPVNKEVEVDLSVEVESDNYDRCSSVADKMNIQTLSSSWSPPVATGYAVGLLKGKKLYLNPVHAVVQLRPSMEYLDYGDQKKKNVNLGVKEEGSTTNVLAGPSRKLSKQVEPEVVEPWVQLNYHSSTSDFAQRYMRNMVTEEDHPMQFSMNQCNYLDSLCPGAVINKKSDRLRRRCLLSLSLPLKERLKKWFVEVCHVNRFSDIMYLAPGDRVEDVLQIVQEYATLVQGVWVAKSQTLRKNPADSLARDYALSLFSQNPIMKDSKLDILGFRKSNAKAVIREIAVERTICKDWKFILPTDVSFLKVYPQTVEAQRKIWEERGTQILDKLKKPPHLKTKRAVPSATSDVGMLKGTSETRSVSTSMSKEFRDGLSMALGKLFLTHKVCRLHTISQGLRDTAVSLSTQPKAGARTTAAVAAVKSFVDAPQEELEAIISEYAVCVRENLYVLKSSSETPELNPLRNIVIDLIRGREPGALLKKGEIMEAAENKPSASEFQKVMNEYCVTKGGSWVLKDAAVVPPSEWLTFFKFAKLL